MVGWHHIIVAASSYAYAKTAFMEECFGMFPEDLILIIPGHNRMPG